MTGPTLFDVVVVDGGLSGVEAALAAVRQGCRVLLLSADLSHASPYTHLWFGGVGTGQLLRELDALGGVLPRALDASVVHAHWDGHELYLRQPRVVVSLAMLEEQLCAVVRHQPNLSFQHACVTTLARHATAWQLTLNNGDNIWSRSIVLAMGRGEQELSLHASFRTLGLQAVAWETANKASDVDQHDEALLCHEQPPASDCTPFAQIHQAKPLQARRSMYSLQATAALPANICIDAPPCVIEYAAFPQQTDRALMVRGQRGLFLGGWLLGSNGQEESAALGFLAGVNAARWVKRKRRLELSPEQSLLGLLVTQLVDEPWTQPHRSADSAGILRRYPGQTVELRLAEAAQRAQLWSPQRVERVQSERALLEELFGTLADLHIKPQQPLALAIEQAGLGTLRRTQTALQLLQRSNVTYKQLAAALGLPQPDPLLAERVDVLVALYQQDRT